MNSKRTQRYFIEVLKKPTSATMIALIICLIGSHLTITVNAQFSRNDYRSGFLVTNPCVSKQTCSECLQTPTCAWCMKEVRDVYFRKYWTLIAHVTESTFQIFYIFYSQDYTSTDGAPLPRCNQEEFYTYGDVKGGGYSSARNRCPASQVINPDNVFRILENRELIQESQYQQAVQIKPQHVSLTLRISKSVALKLCV